MNVIELRLVLICMTRVRSLRLALVRGTYNKPEPWKMDIDLHCRWTYKRLRLDDHFFRRYCEQRANGRTGMVSLYSATVDLVDLLVSSGIVWSY